MKSVIKKIIWLTISFPFVVFMAVILLVLIPATISESLARALAPPQYPNSILVEDWVSGGPISLWDRKSYSTTDSPEEVLSFMKSHLGGFEVTIDGETGKTTYHRGECNESILARVASLGLGVRPCASIRIYDDPNQPDVTLIRVWVEWPAP